MKALVLIFSLLSVQAFACPNFTGTYTCQDEETGSYQMDITQRNISGGTVYTSVENGETYEFIVDGKSHVADPEQPNVVYVANCSGNIVNSVTSGPLEEDGQTVGSMKAISETFLRGNDLVTKSKATIIYGDQEFQQDYESSCSRN